MQFGFALAANNNGDDNDVFLQVCIMHFTELLQTSAAMLPICFPPRSWKIDLKAWGQSLHLNIRPSNTRNMITQTEYKCSLIATCNRFWLWANLQFDAFQGRRPGPDSQGAKCCYNQPRRRVAEVLACFRGNRPCGAL